MDSTKSTASSILQALISRGWRFRDQERIQGIIDQELSDHYSTRTVESVESELLNMDLRSIGGPCLPESSALCKVSNLRGPMVLQISSVRDITKNLINDTSGNSGNRRLLLLKLTDGRTEVKAIEYSHVPSLHEDIVPGTKVLLQNEVDICNGILCLNKMVVIILGGVVQSLHEEWQMKRKYMVESHQTLKLSRESVVAFPPPFEKFDVRTTIRGSIRTSNDAGQSPAGNEGTKSLQGKNLHFDDAADGVNLLPNIDSDKEKTDLIRPKMIASVPVQNQVAVQKLLQKTMLPNSNHHNARSQRYRGKGKQEDSVFLTLDEWERRKNGTDFPTTSKQDGIGQDEDLARRLQQQFDLEDSQEKKSSHVIDADNIKMSMFNFERDDAKGVSRDEFRGRGRGRGRRTRGRGRN